jgi:hypothetical protein
VSIRVICGKNHSPKAALNLWYSERSERPQQGNDNYVIRVAITYELYQDENSAAYKKSAASNDAAGAMFAMANQRFNATKKTKDAIFILTKFEESGVNGLVKVDKDSGKQLVKIPFGDKDPAYIR